MTVDTYVFAPHESEEAQRLLLREIRKVADGTAREVSIVRSKANQDPSNDWFVIRTVSNSLERSNA